MIDWSGILALLGRGQLLKFNVNNEKHAKYTNLIDFLSLRSDMTMGSYCALGIDTQLYARKTHTHRHTGNYKNILCQQISSSD